MYFNFDNAFLFTQQDHQTNSTEFCLILTLVFSPQKAESIQNFIKITAKQRNQLLNLVP